MTTDKIKNKLKYELIQDIENMGFANQAAFANFFYKNYLDESLFENYEQYNYLLKCDRYQKDFFNKEKAVSFFVEHRFNFLNLNKLRDYGIIH